MWKHKFRLLRLRETAREFGVLALPYLRLCWPPRLAEQQRVASSTRPHPDGLCREFFRESPARGDKAARHRDTFLRSGIDRRDRAARLRDSAVLRPQRFFPDRQCLLVERGRVAIVLARKIQLAEIVQLEATTGCSGPKTFSRIASARCCKSIASPYFFRACLS